MVREDMCFNQVVPSKANTSKAWANGFLNRVQSFSLGNDFTASVRPPGAALKHISEYEEHDYCILTHAIDWEDGDVPLPETLERRAVLAIGKAWNAAATGLKAAIVERVARGPHRSPTTDDEEKALWNYLFKAGATLSQLTRTSRYEPFNVVVRPDPEETDEDEEQAPCYPSAWGHQVVDQVLGGGRGQPMSNGRVAILEEPGRPETEGCFAEPVRGPVREATGQRSEQGAPDSGETPTPTRKRAHSATRRRCRSATTRRRRQCHPPEDVAAPPQEEDVAAPSLETVEKTPAAGVARTEEVDTVSAPVVETTAPVVVGEADAERLAQRRTTSS